MIDNALSAYYEHGRIKLEMESGIEISFPVAFNKRLACGTPEQLNNIELSPYGIHWPDLDEDLSFKGLIRGDYGQYIGTRSSRCREPDRCLL